MKKIFAFVLAMVMVISMFTACGNTNTQPANTEATQVTEERPSFKISDLAEIPGYDDYLVYSINTRTVYYMFYYGSQSFMAPYIVNGHTCEYVDGEIIEVIPTVRIEDSTN